MHLEAIYTILWLFACIACITVYCVGFRAITAENKLLYFLREGYDNIEGDEHDKAQRKIRELEVKREIVLDKIREKYNVSDISITPRMEKDQDDWEKHLNLINIAYDDGVVYVRKLTIKRIKQRKWLLKPIVACCTCFASFWGSIIFWGLNLLMFDFHWKMIPAWMFCCVSASFFNWLLWDKINK